MKYNTEKSFCNLVCPYLLAATDGELLEGSDVVDEEIHETQFVAEAHEDIKAGWVECNAVRLLRKLLVQF